MKLGRSIRSWWISAAQTAIGDLFVTATVLMFLFGAAAAVLLGFEYLFSTVRHSFVN